MKEKNDSKNVSSLNDRMIGTTVGKNKKNWREDRLER